VDPATEKRRAGRVGIRASTVVSRDRKHRACKFLGKFIYSSVLRTGAKKRLPALQFDPASAPNAVSPVSSTTTSKFGAQVNELKIIEQRQGTGAEAVSGKAVIVHYTGWLYDPAAADGQGPKFDSSLDRKVPFGFFLGVGKVIKGWDEGVVGMKVGGKRTLVIPAHMGYGERGAGGIIPPNATLLFDVELIEVKG
jgi:FKBP-type peptidyl-prolyl cis-trans isomerase FkpA